MSRSVEWRLSCAMLATLTLGGCGDGQVTPEHRASGPDDPMQAAAPIADQDLLLRVTVESTDVEFGKAFPLVVVRSWSKELTPEEWSDDALAPLVVTHLDTTQRDSDRHVEETRRYLAYAFRRERLTVPAPWFRARPSDGGAQRVAFGEDLRFVVASALAETPGPVELPGTPIPAPFRWLKWGAIALVALSALILGTWFARWRRARAGDTAATAIPPHERALRRLRALLQREPAGVDEVRTDSVESSSLVRDYIEERFSLPAAEMTSEEFLACPDTRRLLPDYREMLAEFFELCDLVKFARHVPDASDRRNRLAAIEAFILETAPPDGPTAQDDPATGAGA